MPWQVTVAEKRRLRAIAIDAVRPVLSGQAVESDVLEPDVASLTARLATGSVTAEQVAVSYIRRAVASHDATNCISEPLFEAALQRARELDAYFRAHGKLVGPLHGVPISIKDQFNVRGVDSTLGYVGRSFRPAASDAALVVILKQLGAVIIAKTCIPQSILWGETESPLWGLTTHPINPLLTPGGSSGGEVALLAMGGAICGWGTDIGGSIRGPSHFCGLYGLKPSSARFPYAGVPTSHDGQNHVPSSVGPISPDLATLVATTRMCLDAEPWRHDPAVVPLPWREQLFQDAQAGRRPLKIGAIFDDGVVRPHPEVELAVRRLATLLERAGHAVIVPWDTADHTACIAVQDQFYRADGGDDIRADVAAAGEPFLPHVAALVDSARPISVHAYWQLNRRKVALQEAYNAKWNATGADDGQAVDVIISPVVPHTAAPHRSCRWVGYTKIWSFLDYAAMSVPFARLSLDDRAEKGDDGILHLAAPDRDAYQHGYAPRNEMDAWNHKLYDPEVMDGLPIGVQIIGRRFDEEKVLGVASLIERLRVAVATET